MGEISKGTIAYGVLAACMERVFVCYSDKSIALVLDATHRRLYLFVISSRGSSPCPPIPMTCLFNAVKYPSTGLESIPHEAAAFPYLLSRQISVILYD